MRLIKFLGVFFHCSYHVLSYHIRYTRAMRRIIKASKEAEAIYREAKRIVENTPLDQHFYFDETQVRAFDYRQNYNKLLVREEENLYKHFNKACKVFNSYKVYTTLPLMTLRNSPSGVYLIDTKETPTKHIEETLNV